MIEPRKPHKGLAVLDWALPLWYFVRGIRPLAGPGIMLKETSAGTLISARPVRGVASPALLPLHASKSMDGETVMLSLLGGAYQEGLSGAWVTIPPTAPTAGTFAHLVVEQDEARAITSVAVTIGSTALDPIVVSGGGTATSNIPLAAVVAVGETTELRQYRHGNFTLGIWHHDGEVARWPDTLVGTIPTPEPPEP